ncbi:hypothetical protein L596_018375 [Steinernema carpocapsae]|uniref:Uncharacterized protein n=1 Tax=Steinernema carpocapsae TaxID=34508 RepID=A0A4U5N567_STECR|nr:hypothetical protein L596_018375 [Steinernema carpocapsae]
MGLASYLLLILLLICGSALARGDLKQLTENKAFVERFSDGTFEIVQPKLEESTIRLTPTLVLQVEKNNFTFSDFEDDENCFYQGRIKGVEDSLVALSSCYGLRGILIYPNGTSFGIWPLNRTPNGKSGSHILYSDLLHPSLLNKEDSVRKVQKFRGKFVKIDLELDDISDFANDTSKAEFYFRDATNVADMISSRHMNIRLSAVAASKAAADVPRADLKVALTTAKSLKTHDRSSFAGKLCDVSDREAQIRAEDAPFTTHATASALAIAVGEAVGVPLNIECERKNPFCLIGVVENRRCLHDYPPPQPSSPVTPREFAEIVDTAINVSKKNVVEKRSYQVGSGTIVAIICSAGVLLMILLIVLQLTYRRMAPRDLKPVKEVKIEAPRKRVITFGAMPSYKSEKSRISKNRKVFEALEKTKLTEPKRPTDLESNASTQGSGDLALHV